MLRNKTILILSPQTWGNMFLSKHHYAIELAKLGNLVYFLNPPTNKIGLKIGEVRIKAVEHHSQLFCIDHRLPFPYRLKFNLPWLFQWLMKFHIGKMLKSIPSNVELIWSFDLGNLYPFRFFSKQAFRLFHPVDEPLNPTAIISAEGARLIISVTPEILDKYSHSSCPRYVVNHGVSEDFLLPVNENQPPSKPIHVGFSGNLLRADVDREVLLHIIKENPQVVFDMWGSYSADQTNIGGTEDLQTIEFISQLKESPNVNLHGPVSSHALAKALHTMDAFLICYDVQRDQSRGTNYHKVMEYLSTGKVIVSNNITAYKESPDLVTMVSERTDNQQLPRLFSKVLESLPTYNSAELQKRRIAFARDNSYHRQIERIEKLLQDLGV